MFIIFCLFCSQVWWFHIIRQFTTKQKKNLRNFKFHITCTNTRSDGKCQKMRTKREDKDIEIKNKPALKQTGVNRFQPCELYFLYLALEFLYRLFFCVSVLLAVNKAAIYYFFIVFCRYRQAFLVSSSHLCRIELNFR